MGCLATGFVLTLLPFCHSTTEIRVVNARLVVLSTASSTYAWKSWITALPSISWLYTVFKCNISQLKISFCPVDFNKIWQDMAPDHTKITLSSLLQVQINHRPCITTTANSRLLVDCWKFLKIIGCQSKYQINIVIWKAWWLVAPFGPDIFGRKQPKIQTYRVFQGSNITSTWEPHIYFHP